MFMEHLESITKNSSLRIVVLRSSKHFSVNICTLCISAVISCVRFKVQDHGHDEDGMGILQHVAFCICILTTL